MKIKIQLLFAPGKSYRRCPFKPSAPKSWLIRIFPLSDFPIYTDQLRLMNNGYPDGTQIWPRYSRGAREAAPTYIR